MSKFFTLSLIFLLLNNVLNFADGEHKRKLHPRPLSDIPRARSLPLPRKNCGTELTEENILVEMDSYSHSHFEFALNLFKSMCKSLKRDENLVISPVLIGTHLIETLLGFGRCGNESTGNEDLDHRDQLEKVLHLQNISRESLSHMHKSHLESMGSLYYHNMSRTCSYSPGERTINETIRFHFPNGSKICSDGFSSLAEVKAASNVSESVFLFTADWRNNFETKNTFLQGLFYTIDQERTELPVMVIDENVPYGYSMDLQTSVLELPLRNGRASLFILLPDQIESNHKNLENNLTTENVRHLLATLTEHSVNIRLPRFGIYSSLSLISVYCSLGISAMCQNRTQFQQPNSQPLTTRMFFELQEQSRFTTQNQSSFDPDTKTDEQKSRMNPRSNFGEKYFQVDHPFIFFVWDYIKSHVIVMGRVMLPGNDYSEV